MHFPKGAAQCVLCIGLGLALLPKTSVAEVPKAASSNGKYSEIVQVLNCPNDRTRYGESSDYGYWEGGSWCQQTGAAGYWVWVYPNWYIWKRNNEPTSNTHRPYIDNSSTGSAVFGEKCSYVTAGGMTYRSCD